MVVSPIFSRPLLTHQDIQTQRPVGSLIKWAGSKAGSANRIIPYLETARPYIEPFCGSATFFFRTQPTSSFLNDNNPALISFYKQIAKNPKAVWQVYDKLPVSEEIYYEKRMEFNKLKAGIEKAGLFLYLNHFGFNGIYRTNSKGELNTPFGAKIKIRNKTKIDDLMFFSKILKRAKLSCLDFEKFLVEVNPQKSCIYIDPPYFTDDRRVFGEYGALTFKGADLERLKKVSIKMAENENKVIVSYKDCSEFQELFSKYIIDEIKIQRNVGGFKGRRKIDTELIAIL